MSWGQGPRAIEVGLASPLRGLCRSRGCRPPKGVEMNSRRLFACEKLSLGDLFRKQMDRVLPLEIGGSQGSDGKVACTLENSSTSSVRLLWWQGGYS